MAIDLIPPSALAILNARANMKADWQMIRSFDAGMIGNELASDLFPIINPDSLSESQSQQSAPMFVQS